MRSFTYVRADSPAEACPASGYCQDGTDCNAGGGQGNGAINTVTGKTAWTIPILTTSPGSGMSVAGDLVFFGDTTGLFYGASAATGEILWVFDAFTVAGGGGAASSPAIYQIGGTEYVVYGFGNSTYNTSADAVIAFALPSSVTAAAAKARAK